MLNREPFRPLLLLYEALLCVYIVIAPINNALNDQGFRALVGYCAMLLLVVGTPCGWLGGAFGAEKKLGGLIPGVYLITVVALLGSLLNLVRYYGLTQLLMYTQFISVSRRVNLKKILIAFYWAAVVAAAYSVSLGMAAATVSRTAAAVDGSIAPAVLAIVLFLNEDFEITGYYKTMKYIALACATIVALFGMSRSRLLLLAVMLIIKLVIYVRRIARANRISQTILAMIPFIILAIVIIANMNVTRQLLEAIGKRYEAGFEDTIRRHEREAGWELFRYSWLTGRGWNKLCFWSSLTLRIYHNHNMYITILARGGLVLAIPMFYSFVLMIKRVIEQKDLLAGVLLGLFFALGYGNAGAFNYTICSMMIPMAILLDKEKQPPVKQEK